MRLLLYKLPFIHLLMVLPSHWTLDVFSTTTTSVITVVFRWIWVNRFPLSSLLPPLLGTKPFEISALLLGRIPFHTHTTVSKKVEALTPKPGRIPHWLYLFFIHQWTPDRKNADPFTPALRLQCRHHRLVDCWVKFLHPTGHKTSFLMFLPDNLLA